MKTSATRWALLGAGLLAGGAALAAKVPVYDDFSSTTGLDRTKWFQSEEGRFVDAKQALVGRRLFGNTASDTGLTAETYSLSLPDGTPPKGLSADITVITAGPVEACAANPLPSASRARLMAAYFNARAGGPVPGDRTGDVLAQIRLLRASNSVDPVGVVTVQGSIVQCTNADCSTSTTLHSANFGQTTEGTKLNARIDWLKASKTFRFTVDSVNVQDLVYTEPHGNAPVTPFVQIAIRNEAANCTAGRVKTGMVAKFDNVRVVR